MCVLIWYCPDATAVLIQFRKYCGFRTSRNAGIQTVMRSQPIKLFCSWRLDFLYVNLNEAITQLVRIIWGSTCVISSVSYVCLPRQYIVHLQIAPDGAFTKYSYQADVSMDFHTRLEQPPKLKFDARVSSRVSFLYLKSKPNLVDWPRPVTWHYLEALRYKGHSSVVM